MTGRVEGKVALVTGAGRGQGRAEAIRLAEEGAEIIAVDVPRPIEGPRYEMATAEDLKETAAAVEARGRRVLAKEVDVRDLDMLKAVVDEGVRLFGKLDTIVANAGVCIAGPWRTQTPEVLQTTLDVNLTGVYNTVWAGVEHLIANGKGSVIITSSSNGLRAGPFNLAYNSSKYALVGLAKSFAMELAKDGIRVNTIHPGAVDTGMGPAFGGIELGAKENPNLYGMLAAWRPGAMEPVQIANAVLFLASDESEWVTGATLAIDGGGASY